LFTYGLHSPDGDDLGEATYAVILERGEEITADRNPHFRVVAVVPTRRMSRRSSGR